MVWISKTRKKRGDIKNKVLGFDENVGTQNVFSVAFLFLIVTSQSSQPHWHERCCKCANGGNALVNGLFKKRICFQKASCNKSLLPNLSGGKNANETIHTLKNLEQWKPRLHQYYSAYQRNIFDYKTISADFKERWFINDKVILVEQNLRTVLYSQHSYVGFGERWRAMKSQRGRWALERMFT